MFRGPTPARSTGNGGSELRRAPRPPSPGKEREGELCPARCPRQRVRAGRGRAGQAERDRPEPAAPAAAPPPAPAPGLTVLVVLEVVVGAGPAAALGRVLHVVELQKVRPLAREAQEGGGQAPRQGHQPPGAGESRDRAEEAAGRVLPSPTPPATGARGARGAGLAPPGAVRCGTGGRGLCAARERGPAAGPGSPILPAPSGQVQRRPAGGGSAPRGTVPRPSRRGGEKSGSRPSSAPLTPSRIIALLLPRLPTGPSERACGGEPLSLPGSPSRERLSGRPSASRPLRTAPHRRWNQRSCGPGLTVRGAQGSQDPADTPSLPVGTRGRLSSALQAAPFLLLFYV